MRSISAVLPAYNEEAVIAATVQHVRETLERLVEDFEVIVVNDGSRDATARIVSELAAADPRLRLVSHEVNRGYGAALATGFDHARKEWIFLTDGDKQFDVRELAKFLPLTAEADLIVGYRRPRRDPLLRRLNGWGWNFLVGLLFGRVARDVDCAFKLFRRAVWEAVSVHSGGATFSAELLVRARRAGFRLREVRVSHYPRSAGRATGARPDVILRAFRDLIWLRLHIDEEPPRRDVGQSAGSPAADPGAVGPPAPGA